MKIYDCIIIGAGPAGLTAAIYLKRAGYNIIVISNGDIGGNLNKIGMIENYPGFPNGITGVELSNLMKQQCENLGIEFDYFNKALLIQKKNTNYYYDITLSSNDHIYSKTCIECSGSIPNKLNKEFENNISEYIKYCATCDGPFYKDKIVSVVGGGNSAIDFCCTLSKYCSKVLLIHRRKEFRADKTMLNKLFSLTNVEIHNPVNIVNIEKCIDTKTINITLKKENDNEYIENCSAIFYALGYQSNRVDHENSGDIYSTYFTAGDCSDNVYRQIITACGDGCKIALDAITKLQFLKDIEFSKGE